MRSLIPPLRSGLRGSIVSPPRALLPLPASQCHSYTASTQFNALRYYSKESIAFHIVQLRPQSALKPFPGFFTQSRVTWNSWASREQRYPFSTSRKSNSTQQPDNKAKKQDITPAEVEGFGRSEKATRAAQVNLSARLNKDGSPNSTKPGMGEIIRLLKIARPEAKWLGGECLIMLGLVHLNSKSEFQLPLSFYWLALLLRCLFRKYSPKNP